MFRTFYFSIIVLLLSFTLTLSADAQLQQETKSYDTGIDQHVGALLPLDAKFKQEDGNLYELKHYFQSGRPVLLTLNYSSCPMLCDIQLTKLVGALSRMEIEAGKDFDFLSISIDPREAPRRSREAKEKYVTQYGREATEKAWHFLTADGLQLSIDRVAETVGFRYEKFTLPNEQGRNETHFAHDPCLVLCSPEGKILRYVLGFEFESDNTGADKNDKDRLALQTAILEAKEGKEGSQLGRFISSCFFVQGPNGKYALSALKLMRVAAGATVFGLLCAVVPFWLTRKLKEDQETKEPVSSAK